MSTSRVFEIIDVLLLSWIVIQGEYIRYYEREVHRIHSAREKERFEWREAKRKQAARKLGEANDGEAAQLQ